VGVEFRFIAVFIWTTGGKERRELYLRILIRRVSVYSSSLLFAYYFDLPFSFVACFEVPILRFSHFFGFPFFYVAYSFYFWLGRVGLY
jgi:hypothetical protein